MGAGSQVSAIQYLQGTPGSPATVTGNGATASTAGYTGAIQVELVESAGGTATVYFEGSFDGGTNWYQVGFYQVDGNASLTRTAASVSVTANMKHVYQILDPYPQLRARISAISAASVLVRAYCVPA